MIRRLGARNPGRRGPQGPAGRKGDAGVTVVQQDDGSVQITADVPDATPAIAVPPPPTDAPLTWAQGTDGSYSLQATPTTEEAP